MKISLIQMNSISDKAANLAAAQALIEKAVGEDGPDWILLPEQFDWAGGVKGDKARNAEALPGGPGYAMAQELAAKHRVTVGCTICYDLRFPALFQALVDKGAELIALPAAFTMQTGKDHWETLLRARAIETQTYVCAAAQTGSFKVNGETRQTYGHSLVADPWGLVVAKASDGIGIVSTRIDREQVKRVRRLIPVAEHKRAL
jgi:predicted amidohydrolase